MENTTNVQLTQQEAAALLNLIDIATKSGGMQVAQAAVHLDTKIRTAFQKAEEKPEKGEE